MKLNRFEARELARLFHEDQASRSPLFRPEVADEIFSWERQVREHASSASNYSPSIWLDLEEPAKAEEEDEDTYVAPLPSSELDDDVPF